MGKVVDFKKDRSSINFVEFLDDGYFKLTTLNALDALGYPSNIYGVRRFQIENGLDPDGIVDLELFGMMIQVFEPAQFQDIVTHIEKRGEEMSKKTSRKTWKAVWWLGWLAFFTIWGFIDFWKTVYHWLFSII